MYSLLKNSFSLLLVGFLFSSCVRSNTQTEKLYPIDSLIRAQVYYLSNAKAELIKQAYINDIDDDSTYSPADTTAWFHELDIFSELNSINKPINRDNYEVKDGLRDSQSNLTILLISTTKKVPIQFVKIYYHNSLNNIKKIEASNQEQNALLTSNRQLRMEFQDVYNQAILSAYTIEGGHKMFLGDSVRFAIKGKIIIP
jgi:hypothetical protein